MQMNAAPNPNHFFPERCRGAAETSADVTRRTIILESKRIGIGLDSNRDLWWLISSEAARSSSLTTPVASEHTFSVFPVRLSAPRSSPPPRRFDSATSESILREFSERNDPK